MGILRCMGDIWMYGGVQTYEGIQLYGQSINVWDAYQFGAYRHPQTYRQPDILLHACQLHLKEYIKSFPFPSC